MMIYYIKQLIIHNENYSRLQKSHFKIYLFTTLELFSH